MTKQAYTEAKDKLNEIIAMVNSGECDAQQMWEIVLMIKVYPYGIYELLFNCGDNAFSRITGNLERRRPDTAEYHYSDRVYDRSWIMYPLNIYERQAVLNFAVKLQSYIQPNIIMPEIMPEIVI